LIHPRPPAPPPSAKSAKAAATTPTPEKPAKQAAVAAEKDDPTNQETLQRQSWSGADKLNKQLLFVLLYAPIVALLPIVLWSLYAGVTALAKRDSAVFPNALAALLAAGGALIDFPQYFFFRPDAPHLSEFSPGFWVAAVTGVALLGAGAIGWRLWIKRGLIVFLSLQAAAYVFRMLPDPYTGTIAARTKRTQPFRHGKGSRVELFHGQNGVDIYVTKSEFAGLTDLVKVIQAHSSPGDYLLVYPYHPAINLIADLPTYETDLYVDNDTSRRTRWNWQSGAIDRIKHYQPAVIVLSDWAINNNEASRFSVWAKRTRDWIQKNYDLQPNPRTSKSYFTETDKFEVYTRRAETPSAPPAPPAN
jgi:hypothetical protein